MTSWWVLVRTRSALPTALRTKISFHSTKFLRQPNVRPLRVESTLQSPKWWTATTRSSHQWVGLITRRSRHSWQTSNRQQLALVLLQVSLAQARCLLSTSMRDQPPAARTTCQAVWRKWINWLRYLVSQSLWLAAIIKSTRALRPASSAALKATECRWICSTLGLKI